MKKAIYLAQLTSADLGYRFSWYKYGPYSSNLADDYYLLNRGINVRNKFIERNYPGYVDPLDGRVLNSTIKDKILVIKENIIDKIPKDTTKEDWLELCASYHFIRKIQQKDDESTIKILQDTKPELMSNCDYLIKNGDLPRLSVDIDLNYIGTTNLTKMQIERPKLEQLLEEICRQHSFKVKRMPSELSH